jgi:L-ascorbate metabolism protein UlaG (beta-lactamase superfamily)
LILSIGGKNIYHTGDTGLFYDMKLIGELNKIDYMLLPIGDNYTMGIRDAVRAVEFVNPAVAIPMHYNTFPEIQANPNEFKKKLEAIGKKCKVMEYGEEIEL